MSCVAGPRGVRPSVTSRGTKADQWREPGWGMAQTAGEPLAHAGTAGGSSVIGQSQPERNWYMYQPGFGAGAAISIATMLVPG